MENIFAKIIGLITNFYGNIFKEIYEIKEFVIYIHIVC